MDVMMPVTVMMAFWMRVLQTRHMDVMRAAQSQLHQVLMAWFAFAGLAYATFHRDGRKRLGRKAQR
jgi:hypothetical protein